MTIRPIPELPNHVWLLILDHLDLNELLAVARCNRRFKALAQRTFRITLSGRYQVNSTISQSVAKSFVMLRIFGKGIRVLHAESYVPRQVQRRSDFWYSLAIPKLTTISIRPSSIRYYVERMPEHVSFYRVTELQLVGAHSATAYRIDFQRYFPVLRKLQISDSLVIVYEADILPNRLRTLDMNTFETGTRTRDNVLLMLRMNPNLVDLKVQYRRHWQPNTMLQAIVQLGLYHGLVTLTASVEIDDDLIDLVAHLKLFVVLSKLELRCFGRGQLAGFAMAFRKMNELERLCIEFWDEHTHEQYNEFLMVFAGGNVPRQLAYFEMNVMNGIKVLNSDWTNFVDVMKPCECRRDVRYVPVVTLNENDNH